MFTIETLEQGVKYVRPSAFFIANFEHILPHHALLFLLLIWNMELPVWIYPSTEPTDFV